MSRDKTVDGLFGFSRLSADRFYALWLGDSFHDCNNYTCTVGREYQQKDTMIIRE